jgi:hypothetical protein
MDIFDTDIEEAPPKIKLKPYLEEAHSLLDALSGNYLELQRFQTFDEKDRNNRELARTYDGPLKVFAEDLTELNRKGAGVFITVCRVSYGTGEALRLRALFISTEKPLVRPIALPPSMKVKAGETLNYYWLLQPNEMLENFIPAQAHLARFYGADQSMANLTQALRLPGFFIMGSEPSRVELVECCHDRRYTIAEVLEAHPIGLDLSILSSAEQACDMAVEEAFHYLDALLCELMGPAPDGLKLYEPKTFAALAAVSDQAWDNFDFRLREILYRNNFLRSVVSLPNIRMRVKQRKRAQLKGK